MREQYLIHWRTKGSKNGERRYQYEDGTYTPLGKARRRVGGFWGDVDAILSKRNFEENNDYDDMRSSHDRYGKGSPQKIEDKYKALELLKDQSNDYYKIKSRKQPTRDDEPDQPDQPKQQTNKEEKNQKPQKPQKPQKQNEQKDQKEQPKQEPSKNKNSGVQPKIDPVFKDAAKLSSSIRKITNVSKHNAKVDERNAKIAQMSDNELEEVNKRLGLEKRYKELLDSKASEKAKVEVSDILEAFGNTVAVIQDLSAIGRAIMQEKDN